MIPSSVLPQGFRWMGLSARWSSFLTKSVDKMRVDAIRIEPAGHEIAGSHPGASSPVAERHPGTGRTRGGGHHLHPLECLLDAAGAQRMSVGEGTQQRIRDVVVDDRHAIFRAAAVLRFVHIEKALADGVAFVVLVDAGPSHEGVTENICDPSVI